MCRKCEKTRQFSKLKKYYQDEDLDAAQLARSHAQAKVNNQEKRFEEALDRGVLEQEIESAFSADEYGEQKGLGTLDFEEIDQLLGAPRVDTSKKELVEKIAKEGVDSIEEFENALAEYGYGDGNWFELLRQSVTNERVSISGDLTLQEVLEEKEEDQAEEHSESESEKNKSRSSQKSRLIDIAEGNDGDVSDVIPAMEKEGIPPKKGLKKMEKLIRSGQIDDLSLLEIENAVSRFESEDLGSAHTGSSNEKERTSQDRRGGDSRSKSQPEIVLDAIRAVETSTEEEIVEHAVEVGGLDPSKTRKILNKLYRSGEIYRDDNYEYRVS